MPTYTVHQAKTNLSKLLAEAEAGEDVVIARGDTPVARLTPIGDDKPKREFGACKGQFTVPDSFWDPLPEDELRRWYEAPIFPEAAKPKTRASSRTKRRKA
jgi:prevent-host-death family protein